MKQVLHAIFWTFCLCQPSLADDAAVFICNAGKDATGNRLPQPEQEQMQAILAPVQSYLAGGHLLRAAHQCGFDTSRHATLLFEAIEAIGCAPTSVFYRITIETINHDESSNYMMAYGFNSAREASAAGVSGICDSIATVDPETFDVTSVEDATALGRFMSEVERRLREIRFAASE